MKSTTSAAVEEAVSEIMALQRSLPLRPLIEVLEAARTVIRNADAEQRLKLDAIGRQIKPNGVPEELWAVLQEMRRKAVEFQREEERREAARVLEVEHVHQMFDELILRASRCVGVGGADEKVAPVAMVPDRVVVVESEKNERRIVRDDSFVKKPKSDFEVDGSRSAVSVIAEAPQIVDITLKPAIDKGEGGEKLRLIKLASLIEVSSKKGVRELDLRARLMDQVEWLPDSIGKLSGLVTLDLSENRIVTLPTTIGGLVSLTRLDLHSNRLYDMPESIGDLLSLVYLDLSVNQLSRLPSSVGRLVNLEELKLGSNQLGLLPDAIGSLASLKKLDVETNNLEELPYTIGQCTALKELYADYNRLKALPEAVGRIESLEVLSLRYNNIKQLPTTMGSLVKLRELNVSFNELEVVPESLC
ncbi:Plant intracellular Ras-group-related LRR protein 5-like protein, partial [Drosera capensis]